MRKTMIIALVVGASALALLASACGGESSATAKANFCDSLTTLSSTVMNYQGLDPRTATNDEVDAAADDIADAYDDVVDEANDWANADDNALTAAYNDLWNAIDALPGDNTLAEDYQDLEDELAAFPSAYQQTFDGSGCATA